MRASPLRAQGAALLLPASLLALASDQHIAVHVRGGSERAFEVLFQRYHRPVLAFCQHMLGSRDEAEDVAQQTFLAAYHDLARGREPRALRPWLYGIARHRCISAIASRHDRAHDAGVEPASDHLTSGIVAREELREVLGDLAALPEEQRAALVLAEIAGVAHDDIAQILGCRREKVKALVFQARTSLATARAARDTPCAEVREQLATLTGAALRRRVLRRHLRDCSGCREFRDRIGPGRRAFGLLAPVATGIGLKRALLGALVGPGGGGGISLGAGGLAATAVVAAAIPAAIVGAVDHAERSGVRSTTAAVVAAAPAPERTAATGSPIRRSTPIARRRPQPVRETSAAADGRSAVTAPAPPGTAPTTPPRTAAPARASGSRARGASPASAPGRAAQPNRGKRATRRPSARPAPAPPGHAGRQPPMRPSSPPGRAAEPPAHTAGPVAAGPRVAPGRPATVAPSPTTPAIRSSPSAARCGC